MDGSELIGAIVEMTYAKMLDLDGNLGPLGPCFPEEYARGCAGKFNLYGPHSDPRSGHDTP